MGILRKHYVLSWSRVHQPPQADRKLFSLPDGNEAKLQTHNFPSLLYSERRLAIKELTSKEKLFCTYYCVNRNGRESAVKSGYMFPEKTALKLLKRRDIAEEIARIDKQREATQKDIAIGYRRLAFGCISDAVHLLFSDEVSPEEIEKMDLFNISEIKRKKGGDIEIKFFDRLKALEKLEDLWSTQREDEESSLFSAIEKGARALRDDSYE